MTKQRRSEAIWVDSRQRWQVNVQMDGKRKTFTSTIPGRKGKHEAEAKADDWLDAGQPDDIRFDSAWAIYLDYLKRNTGTANYTDNESIGRIWFLDSDTEKRLSLKKVSKITVADIQSIITAAGDAGRSKRTCKNIRDKFAGFSHFAAIRGWQCISTDQVKIPTQAKESEKRIVQPEQLKRLFSEETFEKRGKRQFCFYTYIFRFIVVTGYRRGEIAGFMRDDYDGNALTVRRCVNDDYEVTQGKNQNARRTTVLSSHAKYLIEQNNRMLRKHGIISPWLFPGEDGDRLDPKKLYKQWKIYSSQIGINVSLHELRHTFVSIAQIEMPEALLKSIVGHSAKMDTSGVYGHEVEGDKQRAADMVDQIFDRVLSNI